MSLFSRLFRRTPSGEINAPTTPPVEVAPPTPSLIERLKTRLGATRRSLADGLKRLTGAGRRLDETLLDEIETLLITADIGVETTAHLTGFLRQEAKRGQLTDGAEVFASLREEIRRIVAPCAQPLANPSRRPFIIMMVGVNGVGKTTTIAKLGQKLKAEGLSVMFGAGDTFRAAAIDQIKVWGERLGIPVISSHQGADAAALAHDAVNAARARDVDVLIIDTAGRQHTHGALMEELRKVRRVITKIDPEAPHEVLMALDAGTGQNALQQLKGFREAVGVTGLVLTKLDGTAKGGVLIGIARTHGLPIRYIGVGETADDLLEFDPQAFVEAILPETGA